MQRVSFYDVNSELWETIRDHGGFVNAHAHIDRAYSLTRESFPLTDAVLQEKWGLVDELKRTSTVDDIYDRMAYTLERQVAQGVTAVGSFIDVDEVIGDKAMQAAAKIRETFKDRIVIRFINQALKGVLDPVARKWFLEGAAFVDIIGGLPGKDKGREAEHLDLLMDTAKKSGKMVHVHVDQLNSAEETETELLCRKTKEHGMQGKVVAVHGVSIAAHPREYRQQVYVLMRSAGVMLVACPTAWIDSRRNETMAPTHNAIAPVEELRTAGVPVALGTDNIHDIYKPFCDGDMRTELRVLLESCHYYRVDDLVRIATEFGRQSLGI